MTQSDSTASISTFETKLVPYHVPLLLALGFLIRVWLVHHHPIIFGGDSIVRLVNRDKILLSHQLPALQAAIHYLGFLSQDLLLVRYFMAVAGAVAGWGFYLMAGALLGRTAAFSAALFFATHPFLLAYSIVPYQEILMLAGLFFSFYFFFSEKWLFASLALGLACLTRYEAWTAAPVLAIAFALQGPSFTRRSAQAVLLFGWAPLVWLVHNAGLAPEGSYVLDLALPLDRFFRYLYLSWITVKFTPVPVLLLAAFGVWRFFSQGLFRSRRYLMLIAFVAIFLIAILFSGHGDQNPPDRYVSAREAHILDAVVLVLAGLGLTRLSRFRTPVIAACLLWGIFAADRFVAAETSEPKTRLSYDLARYLDDHMRSGEHAVVLVKPVSAAMLEDYLGAATRRAGSPGRRKALEILAGINISPPDFQRTLVHSRLAREQLGTLASPLLTTNDQALFRDLGGSPPPADAGLPDWIAVWSDFQPSSPAEVQLQQQVASKQPVEVLRAGVYSVAIYSK
jgi:hypothetical protein